MRNTLQLSDDLVTELLGADHIVTSRIHSAPSMCKVASKM
jgi:hypothetical protein